METSCDRLRIVFLRDIEGVKTQLLAYQKEADLWTCPPGVNNSAGTLALHLAGNLRGFIGAALGHSGYQRNREAEFSRRDVPRDELVAELDTTAQEVDATLRALTDSELEAPFPFPPAFGDLTISSGLFLTHLVAHLTYHVGQMDYHRRLVTGDATVAKGLSIKALLE